MSAITMLRGFNYPLTPCSSPIKYREFLILLDALFEGRPVSYCPYMFVDNDAAIARLDSRLSQATWVRFPKEVLRGHRQSRSRVGRGVDVCRESVGGWATARRGVMTLKEPVKDPSILHQRPVVNLL